MKEIKFRVWDKNTKKMYDVRCIDFLHKAVDAIDGNGCVLIKFEDIEIMQSTGLFDKNGKEIFEGDYIRIYYEYFEDGFVSRDKDGSWFIEGKNHYDRIAYITRDYIEIIGNIYENPELLNK